MDFYNCENLTEGMKDLITLYRDLSKKLLIEQQRADLVASKDIIVDFDKEYFKDGGIGSFLQWFEYNPKCIRADNFEGITELSETLLNYETKKRVDNEWSFGFHKLPNGTILTDDGNNRVLQWNNIEADQVASQESGINNIAHRDITSFNFPEFDEDAYIRCISGVSENEIIVAGGNGYLFIDRYIKSEHGWQREEIYFSEGYNDINEFAILPDFKRTIVAGTCDGKLLFFNKEGEKYGLGQVYEEEHGGSGIMAIDVDSSGNFVTGDFGGNLIYWDVVNGKHIPHKFNNIQEGIAIYDIHMIDKTTFLCGFDDGFVIAYEYDSDNETLNELYALDIDESLKPDDGEESMEDDDDYYDDYEDDYEDEDDYLDWYDDDEIREINLSRFSTELESACCVQYLPNKQIAVAYKDALRIWSFNEEKKRYVPIIYRNYNIDRENVTEEVFSHPRNMQVDENGDVYLQNQEGGNFICYKNILKEED